MVSTASSVNPEGFFGRLTDEERSIAEGASGEAAAMAMRIVSRMAGLLGADRLIEIGSAHIDGCLYHGDSGVAFAERLVAGAGQVCVPTTLNVGALDLLHPSNVRDDAHHREMAGRMMAAYQTLGCSPTWTCAPYQAGHRPSVGQHVAWGESNAVAFANSVLGARTNRYGDFLDICCALTGRAPYYGLHLDEHRRATVVTDVSGLPARLLEHDALYPVLGSWLGAEVGERVAVIDGLPPDTGEDRLKALGAAAASTGAVGLFHVAGVTPEAPDVKTVLGGRAPERTITVTMQMIREARDRLSTTAGDRLDVIALGSPHFSLAEFGALERLLQGQELRVPCYVCTGRGVLQVLEHQGRAASLRSAGVRFIVDTCVVVTPILPEPGGVMMTNSGKFAHYARPNAGYDVIYGGLEDCVSSAVAGRVVRDSELWSNR